ncbi:hypothetical protein [Flammeovirga kamogawensis]|uniref:Surface glycan-binding protein B xyloglucan binding domain-containing protein n=1 Tax=Flammeovirga kamogawensis TaxID=373891 RepID=A0ABX8H4X5_9BACT|nr:hypothetical protein [Flammeovirga kamogawensis]MBB6461719.1 hypothetical protein [Flammeovirga kamogawensis]QWG10637.1 hypothetical protein KM029_24965 [Flammeovirga kamogawensis]TRX63742.1 hypothetical protein EO216_25345 [Flammeovirga kamogawensis]
MNILHKIQKITVAFALVSVGIGVQSCTSEKEFSKANDIAFPQPTIIETSLQENTNIGIPFVIQGENLKNAKVLIGGMPCSDISINETEDELTATLPRIFETSNLRVINAYDQEVSTTTEYSPVYPETQVTTWPARITRGQVFKIEGENVDLIYEVTIDGRVIPVNGANSASNSISILAPGDLPDVVTIKALCYNGNDIPESNQIFVEDPSDFIDPVAPVVLYNFEDGVNPFTPGDVTPQSGIDQGQGITKARGEHYLTVRKNDGDGWTSWMGEIYYGEPIDLVEFTDPHLTFQINSEASQGYFQLVIGQDGTNNGGDFKGGITGNDEDNYVFRATNNEWQWVTIRLADFELADWGGGLEAINPKGVLDFVKLSFKQGNGANPYILNIDNIMITDGPIKEVYVFNNFEDDVHNYSGSATAAINGGSVAPIVGDKFLHITKAAVTPWDWTGTLEFPNSQNIDLAETLDPHISFWANTGENRGNMQFEIFQNETKFGADIDTENYAIDTKGEWVLYSIRLSQLNWGNWGGDAVAPDFGGVLDYFYFGMSTGNVDGETYEVNLDDVMITDGSMF